MDSRQTSGPRVAVYRNSWTKEMLAKLAIPVFTILHRPIFRRMAELAYDFALRWNGFGIGFRGKHHLTHAEEGFLAKFLPTLSEGVLFDVGANNGHYAEFLHSVRPDMKIVAFEPHPFTYAKLQSRLSDLGIELQNSALSDRAGVMQLYDFADDDGSTQASLSAESVGLFSDQIVAHNVEVTTLDAFTAERKIEQIAFLKIDTEGFDINVLRGSKRLLEESRIDAIQFEFIPACIAMHVTMRDFFEVLPDFNFHRLMVDGSIAPLRGYDVKRCEIYVIHNIIASRKDWARRPVAQL